MYKVTIEKVTTADEKTNDYKLLYDSDHPKVQKEGVRQYGYVELVQPVTKRQQIYIQEVDELDVVAVIEAVNRSK